MCVQINTCVCVYIYRERHIYIDIYTHAGVYTGVYTYIFFF